MPVDSVESGNAARRRAAEHGWMIAASATGPLGLLAMRWLFTPDPAGLGTHEQLGLPPCRSIDWFGVPCPGCGVTTSVTWFAHGDPWQSLVVQPLGFVIASAALCALPLILAAIARGRDLGYDLRRVRLMRWWIGLTAVVGVSWVYKIAITL